MKNVIVGTAGHIDHGKTTLIKALTGRDTDRLVEEKKRGITIDLGFTYFDLPSGRRAGIIDVPGHEKFIKNMLAGVIGMDIVTLVVAADEGVMPQTKEHLDILNILGIEKGIIALTKIDLVDKEWLELVKEDIREHLKGTFLENSPIIPISSVKGQGVQELIDTIDKLTEEVKPKEIHETPRLPIDRAFTIAGFGTVITGTLLSGKFRVGDEVQIFPGDKVSRIRNIQVHGENVDSAYAGQRVAINLTGIKKDEIKRGEILAPVNSMKSTMMLDVKLRLLDDSQRIIDNRTRLRLYIGTSEVMCRALLLDREQLTPGESCYAQLRLEEELAAKLGDKFIIRFYSPMMTIGGGVVLEANPPKRKRYDENVIKELEIKDKGDIKDIIEKIIKDKSKAFPSIKELAVSSVIPEKKIEKIIKQLKTNELIITFNLSNDTHVIHKEYFKKLQNDIIITLKEFHKANPLKQGMLKEELRSRCLNNVKPRLGDSFINKLIEHNIIKQLNENISLRQFEVQYNSLQKEIKEMIEREYIKNEFLPLKREELFDKLGYDTKEMLRVYEALIDSGILIKLKDDIVLHKDIYFTALKTTKSYIEKNGSITVSQLRDILDTNRKCSIALLEHFDQYKITKRIQDKRILY